ncbi:MAG: hypothetical protein KIS82_04145 [Ferruginibacter sp.]|nr:hypothetical protein [Ferruginibacter sp.]
MDHLLLDFPGDYITGLISTPVINSKGKTQTPKGVESSGYSPAFNRKYKEVSIPARNSVALAIKRSNCW